MKSIKTLGFLLLMLGTQYVVSAQPRVIVYTNAENVAKHPAFSHAVTFVNSNIAKTSGIIGTNAKGELVTTSVEDQMKQTFDNIREILHSLGAGIKDIVEIETYLIDSSVFYAYAVARGEFFRERSDRPISKTFYAKGLINPKAVVEIAVTATIPTEAKAENRVHLTAVLTAKPGQADALHRELLRLVVPSRNEKGCIQYEVYRSKRKLNGEKEEGTFILHEIWTNREALDAHFQMPYVKEFVKKRETVIENSEIILTEPVEEGNKIKN